MKKLNLKDSFKSNKFRYGGYATLLTVIVIAIIFFVNLVVDSFDLKLDLSKNKLYSLSDQTYKVLDKLNDNINVIGFYEAGKEDSTLKVILQKYEQHSKKVKVTYKDPVANPDIASKYTTSGQSVKTGDLVVTDGNKYKVIQQSDLYNVNYDQQTGQPSVQSLAVEQKVTGAIMYVTSSKNSTIYRLQGHDEKALDDTVNKDLENENYTMKDLNLMSTAWKPEKNDILLVYSPSRDLSGDEKAKILDFFSKGGRAIFVMDYVKDDLPNFNEVFARFGLQVDKSVILEGDSQYAYRSPIYLLPKMESQDIVKPLSSQKVPVLIPQAEPILQTKVKKDTLKIEPVLTTSEKSWAKKDTSGTVEKAADDKSGPFNVAVAVTDEIDKDHTENEPKVVTISTSAFLNNQIYSAASGNIDFFMNSVNWLQDKKDNISIRAKDLTNTGLNINSMQAMLFSGLVVVVIPGAVMVAGIAIWVRRRHL